MKKMRKLFSLIMAMAMVMSLTVAANAAQAANGTITITNAAKGATYNFYKLFDAKVAQDRPDGQTDGIAYTGEIPESLEDYFRKDQYGQITLINENVDNTALQSALAVWAKTQNQATASKTNNQGGPLTVSVPYGYYVILSNVGDGSAVTVDSTNPNAVVTDKNTTTTPVWPTDGKTVNGTVFEMGTTATYTVTLKTVNWVPGADTNEPAVKVTEYTISDNFAEGKLTNVSVTSIKIGDATTITGDEAQFVEGKITLPWVDGDGESLYENGVDVVITYTATVSGTGKMENTVSATYKTDSDPIEVPNDPKADVYNSTIVVNKYTGSDKDDTGNKLAGAKFALTNSEGKYYSIANNVVSWVEDVTGATIVTTDENGFADFQGLADGTYNLIETEAPAGYNKLTGSVEIVVSAADDAHVVSYIGDVQNNIGAELPSTGGMGTTIFTVVGGALMVGAAVLFITKKRSED